MYYSICMYTKSPNPKYIERKYVFSSCVLKRIAEWMQFYAKYGHVISLPIVES